MEVAEGIDWVDGVRWSNVYIVSTEEGLLLVDTGTGLGRTTGRIFEAIEALGYRPRDVHDIVLTHYDADHVGGLAAIKARTGARVAIHEFDAPVVMKKEPPGARVPLLVRVIYRWFQRPVTPDRLLKDGDVVGGLRVVHVPGHTPGSIALIREDGAVFSGDALLADEDGNVLPPDPRLAEDADLAAASAERIMALHPRPLLPGHGAPSSESRRAAVKRAVGARQERAVAEPRATLAERFDTWTVLHPHVPALRFGLALPALAWRLGLGPTVSRIRTVAEGSHLVMLTVTGRTSGLPRHLPVALHEFRGEEYLWCPYGSRAQWFRNVVANPVVTLQSDSGTEVKRAVAVEDLDDLMAIVADLRDFDETLLRSYLSSETIKDTPQDLAANAHRLHVRRLEPTSRPGPPPLEADLRWVWILPPAVVAAVLLGRRRPRAS